MSHREYIKPALISTLLFALAQPSWARDKIVEKFLKLDPKQKYLVSYPDQYDPSKGYPLLITVHWALGSADVQCDQWQEYADKEQFIVVCPQFYHGYQWHDNKEDQKLVQIIEELKDEIYFYQDKVFLLGYSGGAQFSHRFVFKHPEYIKAVCVMSAGGYDEPPHDPEVKKVKFFVSVGELDEPRYEFAVRFISLLEKEEYNVEHKYYPSSGHGLYDFVKSDAVEFLKKYNN